MSENLKDTVFYSVCAALVGGVDTLIVCAILIAVGVSIAPWVGVFSFFFCAVVAFMAMVLCRAAKDVSSVDW